MKISGTRKTSRPVAFLDLPSLHAEFQCELEGAIRRVLKSGHYVLANEVKAFEKEFATYCGTRVLETVWMPFG
jgi:dTDP-4-amino-4,6-dideoxygalactose transaminase